MAKFARVIVDQSGGSAFDYEIPDALQAQVQAGSRVCVPVRSRSIAGTVIALLEETEAGGVRPIERTIGQRPVLSALLIRLAQWMANYYCCPLETAMRTILPQVIRNPEAGHKMQLHARLARAVTADDHLALQLRSPKQAAVLDFLMRRGEPVAVANVLKECGASRESLASLERKGLVVIEQSAVLRDPHEHEVFVAGAKLQLNAEQQEVFASAVAAMNNPANAKPILLHGVTGSGKTEIYLQAIDHVLQREQTAIMLVPEISLTPQTVERFKSRFADSPQTVAVLHSLLSEGERHDEWHKINEGRARIVIGARSAIFAPLENVGLIVVDEEHENTYKQEEAPRYHARDIAVLRAKMAKCAVILGSATPSIESYHNVVTGKYLLQRLTQRVDDQKMPRIRIVDMRQEAMRQKSTNILSSKLCAALGDRLEKREQSILFLNRRGFSTSLICSACGHVCECINCSVALTYHRAAAKLICHICGHQAKAPLQCPGCSDPKIRYAGTGTEKVEEAVEKVFPKAVVRRMDADTMARKGSYRETLGAFRTGKIDILVGTQMIAKGLHFPNVTLVGIINADLALHLPDFRAGERTFQLLTQVAGRAGRGDVDGEVFVQTFTPFSPSIQFARHHDFEGFWDQEIEFRERWNYPPFTHMTLITIRSPHETKASFSAETLARRLKEVLPASTYLGAPAPAPLEKSHGNYRFHLVLRTREVMKLSQSLRGILDKLTFPEDVVVSVDVDAYHLL